MTHLKKILAIVGFGAAVLAVPLAAWAAAGGTDCCCPACCSDACDGGDCGADCCKRSQD